jgi:hypothetical protein
VPSEGGKVGVKMQDLRVGANAADFRISPLSITEIPQVSSGVVSLV